MSRATIGDVATLAGVSKKTVSRVLNNEVSVKADTRQQVQAAIEQLGYKPDLSARRLRTGQTFLLAILYPAGSQHADPYVTALLRGALTACDEFGYDLLLRPVPPFPTESVQMASDFIGRTQVDGVILSPPACDNKILLEYLDSAAVPYVRIAPRDSAGQPSVVTDEVSASREAINYLIGLGHKKIAIINPLLTHGAGIWRSEGYRQALAENSIEVNPGYLLETEGSPDLEKNIRRLLSLPEPPTAIFAVNDSFAATVYKVAYQLGIAIPHQLSVIGFDDAPLAQFLWPPLSSVRQPIFELAEQAVAVLVKSLLQQQSFQANTLHCSLVQRSSVAPLINRIPLSKDESKL